MGRCLGAEFDAAFVPWVDHVRHLQGCLAARLGGSAVKERDKGEQSNSQDVFVRSPLRSFAEVVSGGSLEIVQVRGPCLKAADDQDGRILRRQLICWSCA